MTRAEARPTWCDTCTPGYDLSLPPSPSPWSPALTVRPRPRSCACGAMSAMGAMGSHTSRLLPARIANGLPCCWQAKTATVKIGCLN